MQANQVRVLFDWVEGHVGPAALDAVSEDWLGVFCSTPGRWTDELVEEARVFAQETFGDFATAEVGVVVESFGDEPDYDADPAAVGEWAFSWLSNAVF